MGQPGSRGDVIGPSLIIDKGGKRPAWARRLDWLLSALMWGVYFYLIRDALVEIYEIAREIGGWALADESRPAFPAVGRFLDTIGAYALVIAVSGAALIAWARYNQMRFRGNDRHRSRQPVHAQDLAERYGLSPADIATWQKSRILVIQHYPDGSLVRVVSKDLGLAMAFDETHGSTDDRPIMIPIPG